MATKYRRTNNETIPPSTGTHGGKRAGAGRKPVEHPKRPLGVKVSKSTIDKVRRMAVDSGASQAKIVEAAIERYSIDE